MDGKHLDLGTTIFLNCYNGVVYTAHSDDGSYVDGFIVVNGEKLNVLDSLSFDGSKYISLGINVKEFIPEIKTSFKIAGENPNQIVLGIDKNGDVDADNSHFQLRRNSDKIRLAYRGMRLNVTMFSADKEYPVVISDYTKTINGTNYQSFFLNRTGVFTTDTNLCVGGFFGATSDYFLKGYVKAIQVGTLSFVPISNSGLNGLYCPQSNEFLPLMKSTDSSQRIINL